MLLQSRRIATVAKDSIRYIVRMAFSTVMRDATAARLIRRDERLFRHMMRDAVNRIYGDEPRECVFHSIMRWMSELALEGIEAEAQ